MMERSERLAVFLHPLSFVVHLLFEARLIRFRVALLPVLTTMGVLVVQGCGPSGDSGKAPDTARAPAVSADSATPGAGAPGSSAIPTGTHVALDGAGLTLVSAESGSTRAIAFGTPADQALNAIRAVLGDPIVRTTNQECGAGPIEFIAFDGGLFVAVQKDRFVGWTSRPSGSKKLGTMSGIGLGSTRTELDAAYNVRVSRSTIGTEFMAGGLQGVLASDAASAPITDLWAGANCVAR